MLRNKAHTFQDLGQKNFLGDKHMQEDQQFRSFLDGKRDPGSAYTIQIRRCLVCLELC